MVEFARLASEESRQNARNALITHFRKPRPPLDVVVDLDGGILPEDIASLQLAISEQTGCSVALKCHEYVDGSGTFWFIGVVDATTI